MRWLLQRIIQDYYREQSPESLVETRRERHSATDQIYSASVTDSCITSVHVSLSTHLAFFPPRAISEHTNKHFETCVVKQPKPLKEPEAQNARQASY